MSETSQQAVSILAVEDDPGDFGLIKAYARLAKLGNTGDKELVTWAKTLADGITIARNSKPAVVLLDLSLPDSDGLATVQTMRAALPDAPIVVLTGRDDNALAVAALQAGAQDYLVKGQFDHDALGRTVRHAMARHALELKRKENEKALLDSHNHLKEQVGKMTFQLKELKDGGNTANNRLFRLNAPPTTGKKGSGQDGKKEADTNASMRNQPELSQRQHQILKLLQAGKVNKEVANELGIGLGTVKQHLVAIFKKLNVSNRAMAASHGMEIFHEQETRSTALPIANLLECRPCVVLSIALPQDAGHPATRLMYGSLAALASANDAIFLARNGNAGDIIFGIQRVTEYDLAIALKTARALYDDLLAMDAQMAETGETEAGIAGKLRGCMTAGVAFASMKRFGGWTGEAIASAAIASARELLNDVSPGQFVFDQTALDLIELFGIGGAELSPTMLFRELKNLHWTGSRKVYHLVGRDAELARLYAALTGAEKGNGRLIFVEGEMGMGKTRLCDAIAKLCLKHDGRVAFCRSLPPVLGKCLYDTVSGAECSAEQVAVSLRAKPSHFPELIVVDDFHLLAKEQQVLLSAAGADAIKKGKLVIFSGRRGGHESAEHPHDEGTTETINLRRLPAQATQVLVRNALGKCTIKGRASKVQQITSAAAGVPLFAVELARHHEAEQLALPLRVAINARLDSLPLDRNLLREVAKGAVGASLQEVAAALGESADALRQQVAHAVAAGVLICGEGGWLSFTHPLLRRTIDNFVME